MENTLNAGQRVRGSAPITGARPLVDLISALDAHCLAAPLARQRDCLTFMISEWPAYGGQSAARFATADVLAQICDVEEADADDVLSPLLGDIRLQLQDSGSFIQ